MVRMVSLSFSPELRRCSWLRRDFAYDLAFSTGLQISEDALISWIIHSLHPCPWLCALNKTGLHSLSALWPISTSREIKGGGRGFPVGFPWDLRPQAAPKRWKESWAIIPSIPSLCSCSKFIIFIDSSSLVSVLMNWSPLFALWNNSSI